MSSAVRLVEAAEEDRQLPFISGTFKAKLIMHVDARL